MNSSVLKGVGIIIVGLLIGLFLMSNVLTSGGNVVSNFYRYIPFAFAIIGFISPRVSLYYMSVCIVGLGYLKKTMVLDGYFAFDTLYYVVGSPAILLLGMCASTLIRLAFTPSRNGRQWSILILGVSVSLALMAFMKLKGEPIALAVMTGAFANILWVLPLNVRNEDELKKLLKFTVVLMLGASSVGYYQAIFGLTELDKLYVELGYADDSEGAGTVVGRGWRPFATYGSANAFGWSMLFAASVAYVFWKDCRSRKASLMPHVIWGLAILVAIGGIAISYKKAPMVGLVVLPFAVAMVRSRIAGFFAMATFSGALWAMFQFPTEIRAWCRVMSPELAQIHPSLTLNTINTRLESFETLQVDGAVAWVGPGDVGAHSHTLLSSLMLAIGYIPFTVIVLLGFFGYWFGQKWVTNIFGSWQHPRAKLMSIELGFFFTMLAGALMGTNVHQSFPGGYLWWLVVGYAIVRVNNHYDEVALEEEAAETTEVRLTETDYAHPVSGNQPVYR